MSLSVAVIETIESGDHSHVAHDGEIAVVAPPQPDLDRAERSCPSWGSGRPPACPTS
jgi:hypothetical protein